MKNPAVSDIVGIINKFAPFALAEEWDNVGLQVGDPAAQVTRLMVSLDGGGDTVQAAIDAGCQLLLTHHPFIFTPLRKITSSEPTGSLVTSAIRHNLAVISLHTNLDVAAGGVNDLLAERLGIGSCVPLKVTGVDELVKMAVYVPLGHESPVLEALFPFCCSQGNYDECSFSVAGTGTFKPLAGAKPFIGRVGAREEVAERRLELLLKKQTIGSAVKALLKAHPYEEPSYDLYPLLNQGGSFGLGRIGELSDALTLEQFAALIKERLGLSGLRYVGEPGQRVRKVALCGGSGASLLRDAQRKGADVLVTGDVKYHEAREAEAFGLSIVDAGHFATERLMIRGVAETLQRELAAKKLDAEILQYEGEREPFHFR